MNLFWRRRLMMDLGVMMMKIKEYGHIKPKEVKCQHCGALLEYVNYDLEYWKYGMYYLVCPVCKGNIMTDNDGYPLCRDDI